MQTGLLLMPFIPFMALILHLVCRGLIDRDVVFILQTKQCDNASTGLDYRL